jgi:hypothetical protein
MNKADHERRRYLTHILPNTRRPQRNDISISNWVYVRAKGESWDVFSAIKTADGKENQLGVIKRFKSYAFFPEKGIYLESNCLRDIANFLDSLKQHA